LIVHFPIAFLSGAALLYFLSAPVRFEWLRWPALWVLILGDLGAAASVATGLYAKDGVMLAQSVQQSLLQPHMRLMLAASAIAALLTIWALIARPMPQRGKFAFLAAMLVMLGVMTRGADYGGRMVYDYNAGGNACSQPIDFTK
ncbi:MAG TPA: DUF2231 domain-containing protein, partial [Candidatus Binataceae bacterium]